MMLANVFPVSVYLKAVAYKIQTLKTEIMQTAMQSRHQISSHKMAFCMHQPINFSSQLSTWPGQLRDSNHCGVLVATIKPGVVFQILNVLVIQNQRVLQVHAQIYLRARVINNTAEIRKLPQDPNFTFYKESVKEKSSSCFQTRNLSFFPVFLLK